MQSSPQPFEQENVQLKEQNQKLSQENKELLQKLKLMQEQMAQLKLEKSNPQPPQTEEVAPKKCSHGHHDHDHGHDHSHEHGHSHGHGHGHGHSHGHNHSHNDVQSSEQQNPSQPANTVVTPPTPKAFLHKLFKTQQQINFRYFRLPAKTVKAWKKDQNVDLTKNKSIMLHLREMKLNVPQFVTQTWTDVEWINLPECQIDDQGWRILVENAANSFPDLRVIGIRWNKITTIKQGDLEQFKELRMIDLGLQSQENNPLTPQSREVLKKFGEAHPTVKID